MSDTYGEKTRRGDQWGGDWAEWRLPEEAQDNELTRSQREAARHQRLRDVLCDVLSMHRMKRPDRSMYRPLKRRPGNARL